MAPSCEGGGSDTGGLTRWRTGLFAGLCALASFDAFADPYADVFGAIFLGVGAGFLACIVVELAAGRGIWYRRLAIGVGFAFLNFFLYILFLNILIQMSIASGPSTSESGGRPVIVAILAAWAVPAVRLGWLLRRRRPPP